MFERRSKIVILGLAAAAVFGLSGCMMAPYPVVGIWSQDVRVPLDGKMGGAKEGRACAVSYAGAFAMGDASVKAAAENGGITRVQSVEAVVNSRIVFAEFCTIVRGS